MFLLHGAKEDMAPGTSALSAFVVASSHENAHRVLIISVSLLLKRVKMESKKTTINNQKVAANSLLPQEAEFGLAFCVWPKDSTGNGSGKFSFFFFFSLLTLSQVYPLDITSEYNQLHSVIHY